MSRLFLSFLVLLCARFTFAQNSFEGSFDVEYRNEKKEVSKLAIKVKDNWVHLKNTQGGIAKYDYYLLNLESGEFYTVSTKDKKIIIKYNLEKLLEFYEREGLKEGYKQTSDIEFKSTDKTKDENGNKLTKYTGENEIYKAAFWLSNSAFNFNQLIPLLRLIGCWNGVQAGEGVIFRTETNNKISKRESTVLVSIKKEPVSKSIFEFPKDYQLKDFSKLMDENKNHTDLKLIIQTFAGF